MSDELRELMEKIQNHNQQLQTVVTQKQNFLLQQKEVERALKTVKNSESDDVYRSVGPILVKSNKEDILKNLEETMEDMDLRVKTLESQEKKLKESMKESQEKFETMAANHDKSAG